MFDIGQTTVGEGRTLANSPYHETAIALFQFAAEAVIHDFLDGRTLAEPLRSTAVSTVRARLIHGWLPLLDDALRARIEEAARRSAGDATHDSAFTAPSLRRLT
jgi:hypothetical protein